MRRFKIAKRLVQARDAEQEYCDQIPENLSSSIFYDRSEEWLELIVEVIGLVTSL